MIESQTVCLAWLELNKRVLMEKRQGNQIYSGYWALPGGKVESNETCEDALIRECFEELAIEVKHFKHISQYEEKTSTRYLCFQVYEILSYKGIPYGKEGQPLLWVSLKNLVHLKMPPRNYSIISSILSNTLS